MHIHLLLAQLLTTTALAAIYPRNLTTPATPGAAAAAAGDKSVKEAGIPSEIGSVVCVSPGQPATATWVNALQQTCSWTGVVGSNFGPRGNGNEYSCNGRCGSGCTGLLNGFHLNAYTQDCFSHDICSWFYSARGGAGDPNCGKAFQDAQDDYVFGVPTGCVHANPQNAVKPPTTRPVCR